MNNEGGILVCDLNGGIVGNCPYKGVVEKIKRLQREVNHCRNELCLRCGKYHDAHLGACDDCRFKHGGEWSKDLDE